ncbi:MAG: hypothetical protein CVV13_10525 [Gammaproteobacteria bacterium HGW-Gammaproteobacteria-3]|nr:MAG: hypothetical protein CVV13_10525 [Gammaproteobacteria bacterium HGW-Gammaproteobacteria-3]
MNAQVFPVGDKTCEQPLNVSIRVLLGLYAIIPLCLLLQGADILFWQGYLQQTLPSSPTHFLLFQLIFGTPHIVASAIILTSNSDYFGFYKHKILGMTLALAVFFGIGSLFIPYLVFYVLVASWTVYHVLKQQHGIARGVCRLPEWAFHLLLGLSVVAGLMIYIGIFLKNHLDAEQAQWLRQGAALLCAGLVLSTLWCQRYVGTAFGKYFLWSNSLLVFSSFYLYVQQYYFLAILVPRLVHDATAYIFYITHDYNRHHRLPQNFIYSLAKRSHVPVFLVLPLLSLFLAVLLQQYGDAAVSFISEVFFGVEIRKAVTLGLLGYLALMHYYTEAFTWKNASPYRRFIAFSK